MAPKARTRLTSLERLEQQLQAITPDRAQGGAWEKALKGWINAGGHPELTKAWMWGEWPGKLREFCDLLHAGSTALKTRYLGKHRDPYTSRTPAHRLRS